MLISILVFLFVIGVLVFFHELGHFLAAKACGIYVDRFSLGMPPRVAGFKYGETDYCIGALPIGGYVKMAGQEDVPSSEAERQEEYADVPPDRWFVNKPVWQRMIVIAAGPLMNVVLAVILYGMVAGFGAYVPSSKFETRIGSITPESPAATAPMYQINDEMPDLTEDPDTFGWRTGDRIMSIEGEPVSSIADVAIDAIFAGESRVWVNIERTTADGETDWYTSPVVPRVLGDERHPRFGIEPFQPALVGRVVEGSPAEEVGLQPDDVIVRLNGEPIDAPTFTERVSEAIDGEPVEIEVRRDDELLTLTVMPRVVGRIQGVVFQPPLHSPDEEDLEQQPVVLMSNHRPDRNDEAEDDDEKRLMRNDVILEVDGEPASVALLRERTEDQPGETITLTVQRPAVMRGLLREGRTLTIPVEVKPTAMVGIVWAPKMVFHREPLLRVIPEAVGQTRWAFVITLRTLGMLVTGGLGISDLGGPVMIAHTTAQAARMGYSWLLELMAFISVNLCIFNLLPLPVLDGGHLVGLVYEGVLRRPVNRRVAEVIQQVGLALIIALILLVTFSDIRNLITSLLP